jgi:hypothetical protein
MRNNWVLILKLLLTLVTLDNKRFSESQTANSQPQKVDFQRVGNSVA